MATKTKKLKKWIAVLWTSRGQHIIIRGNPTDDAVRNFVQIQRYRVHNHIPTGPGGGHAHYVESADIWADEAEFDRGEGSPVRSINLDEIPSIPELPTSN